MPDRLQAQCNGRTPSCIPHCGRQHMLTVAARGGRPIRWRNCSAQAGQPYGKQDCTTCCDGCATQARGHHRSSFLRGIANALGSSPKQGALRTRRHARRLGMMPGCGPSPPMVRHDMPQTSRRMVRPATASGISDALSALPPEMSSAAKHLGPRTARTARQAPSLPIELCLSRTERPCPPFLRA